ncbi:Mrp/NBP35 family ATP-binding protein [Paenibacillus sediminis]|uniref:Iron-sulfur cluster carrier protein n=1 Tax=Paenibacillus sediminis TaxID=664909 RepID=A0ABS4H734_9BACL|nr:Mrp/NBP35 family ATP-binding protein [Paenibacillus sediminis]MBP1938344.1 ATP-binding protein involved in chromosome partitioning [Paenibacillus sediminis]
MLSREQVLETLQTITDRSTGKSYIEMQLMRDIMVKENHVSLTVVYLEDSDHPPEGLEHQIRERLSTMNISDVHIRFRKASDWEREKAGTKSSSASAAKPKASIPDKGHAAGLENVDILNEKSGVHFIAVASGKGGVGKSTVTVNLATALARAGKRVGIIDADIYGFSIPDMMGIEEGPSVEDGVIQPVERFGVKVMSMGFLVRENAPVVWRGPMLGKMLRQFFSDVNWGQLDYMLLDLPPGTGDVALDLHQMVPHSSEIIVTTPHATAAFVAARAGSMAIQTKHEILGVVENMAYYECSKCGEKDYIFGRGGGGKLAEMLHTDLLAQIPLGAPDNHVAEPDFSPSVYKPTTKIGALYDEMAANVIHKCEKD